jgi:hypothetical protein
MQQVLFEPEREIRTIILSLNPIPFDNIFNGSKKYEYRRKFLKERVSAFIYVTLQFYSTSILYLSRVKPQAGRFGNEHQIIEYLFHVDHWTGEL